MPPVQSQLFSSRSPVLKNSIRKKDDQGFVHYFKAGHLGDNVNFTSTKLGRNVTGVITKIAIKYVTVRTATGLWRVPANMLTRIDEPEFA